MTAERSHGQARTTKRRGSDLRPAEGAQTELERTRSERDERGKAAPGNQLARGRGWKRAITRMLGRAADELPAASAAVAEDAWRLFAAHMRDMPHAGPDVRARVASMARHEALEGFWSARALAVGLDTPEGVAAQQQATSHGQRAERLNVTALDVARVHAAHERQRPQAWPWLQPPQATQAEDAKQYAEWEKDLLDATPGAAEPEGGGDRESTGGSDRPGHAGIFTHTPEDAADEPSTPPTPSPLPTSTPPRLAVERALVTGANPMHPGVAVLPEPTHVFDPRFGRLVTRAEAAAGPPETPEARAERLAREQAAKENAP